MANIVYVRQPYPKGDGDAILRTKNLIGDEPFLVLFGDDIIDSDIGGASQLVQAFEEKQTAVIATVRVKDDEVSSYGIIESDDSASKYTRVQRLWEKPSPQDTSSRTGIIGKYILTPDIFTYLEQVTPTGKDGEIRLADAFECMRQETDIYGVTME